MKSVFNIISITVLIPFVISSCRLDVIEPELTTASVNQPIQDSRLNFINYELNAQSFSDNTSIPVNFNVTRTTLFLSVLAHNSGNVQVEVTNNSQTTIFKTQFSDNFPAYNRSFNDQEISRLKISVTDFTGRLIVRMSAGIQ